MLYDDKWSDKAYVNQREQALGRVIQFAARDLPEGWQIHVTVERGAGWARLYNPEGIRVDDFDSTDLGLMESIQRGIELASSKTVQK